MTAAALTTLIARVADPVACLSLRSPYFPLAKNRRAEGYDQERVDTFVLDHHRPEPATFEQGPKLLLPDWGYLVSRDRPLKPEVRDPVDATRGDIPLRVVQLRPAGDGYGEPEAWLLFTDRHSWCASLGGCSPCRTTDLTALHMSIQPINRIQASGFPMSHTRAPPSIPL